MRIQSQIIELRDEEKDRSWAEVDLSGVLSMIGQYNLAIVLSALHKLGLTTFLCHEDSVRESSLLEGLDPHLGHHLLRYLDVHGMVSRKQGYVCSTSKGRAMFSAIAGAQIGFYVEAYGRVISHIDQLLKGQLVYGRDVERDGGALGAHCATLFKSYHTPTVMHALQSAKATCILDLGCGGGQFIVDACQIDPNLRGIGIDISPPAIDYARRLAQGAGVEDRSTFVVADAFKPESWPLLCDDVDVLCAVGVLHEHFRDGEEAVINILNRYADLFDRKLRVFLLGEPELRYDLEKNDADLFLVHIFTAQGFPRHRQEWLDLFEKTKLHCTAVYTRPEAGPRFNFFQLQPKQEREGT